MRGGEGSAVGIFVGTEGFRGGFGIRIGWSFESVSIFGAFKVFCCSFEFGGRDYRFSVIVILFGFFIGSISIVVFIFFVGIRGLRAS